MHQREPNKSHETTIGEALNKLVSELHLDTKLNELKITESWKELVGELIKSHTTSIYVKERTLFVKVDSSVVRQEMNFMKSRLVDRINRMFPKPLIDQITIL
jgi:predicted nucleic acid-binding Zn ribbon protein